MNTEHNELPIRVSPILLEEELKGSFLDYAMSVIVSRAIPDVRDGLKPVNRRILYAMHQAGFHYNRPYHKAVRVVGDVMGKYHPHGDQAVYNAMVGLVQIFSKRYPLLDGQGNWGSVDGDNAAAMRYTEVRMCKIAQELLADLDKETVDFVPNFDESTTEPTIVPSKIPHLLVNGTAGIAVGMATSIPPHNLTEVIDGCLLLLNNPETSDDDLFSVIVAPDFPTGGIICGRSGIVQAYRTGRGSCILRAVVDVEESKRGPALVVSELPYQVNKSELIIKIADLVKEKIIDGITGIRDESNKKGIRLVIEIRRGEDPAIILNQLYKHTNLQVTVPLLMLALLDNKPIVFSLRQLINEFLYHRRQVIYRRCVYEIGRARDREHIVLGLITVLAHIDPVIKLIKSSESPEEAIAGLGSQFGLSEIQARAVLEMRLQRLTGLEQNKVHAELEEIKQVIAHLQSIISDQAILTNQIRAELQQIKSDYGDARRTRVEGPIDILTEVDLIPDDEVVVTLTSKGYIKRVQLDTYGVQHRGGKGKMGMGSLEESDDILEDIFVAKNHDELLFFTNLGRVYSLQVFQVPEASRTARGRAIVNLLQLTAGERVVKLLCARGLENKFLVMGTRRGLIKRTDASAFAKIRSTGIRALTLDEGDELAFCKLSPGERTIILATAQGQGIHFKESEVRSMGRQAAGVIGIRLHDKDFVVGMEVVLDNRDILFATARGYGKRTRIEDFRIAHRGGYGVRTIPADNRNGQVIGLVAVGENSHIMLMDVVGKVIRLHPKEVRTMGRQAKGVRLIRLDENQLLSSLVSFEEEDVPPTTP